jgi:hypothetical protein
MRLRTRVEGRGTPAPERRGMAGEYLLRDVCMSPALKRDRAGGA